MIVTCEKHNIVYELVLGRIGCWKCAAIKDEEERKELDARMEEIAKKIEEALK